MSHEGERADDDDDDNIVGKMTTIIINDKITQNMENGKYASRII